MPGQEPGAPNQVAAAHQPQPPPPPPVQDPPTQPQHQQHQQQLQQQHQQQQQQPTYPSLAYPPGPSQHHPAPYPPNNYPLNPYYPPPAQHFPHHHHAAQRPHHPNPPPNGFQPAFRYDAYPGYYQPQFYPPYGQMPVPGPGPGTMQNGYYVGGGVGANFQRPYGGFDQRHEDDGSAAYHGNPQFAPQQPFYPPGHPYAYGVGVGYQQQPGMYNGGMGYRPDGGYMGGEQQPPPHGGPNGTSVPPPSASSKGLNPAAQGFNYPVRKTEPLSRTTSSANANANGLQPNGHASAPVVTEQAAPAQVPERAQDAGSLGLSLEPAPVPSGPEPAAAAADTHTSSTHESAPVKPPREPEQPETTATTTQPSSLPPPSTTDAKDNAPSASIPHPPSSLPLADPEPVEPSGLTFTGESLAGLSSPSSSPSMGRVLQLTPDPVRLRPHRPAPDAAEGNSYAAHLARYVPASVKSEVIPDDGGDKTPPRTSRRSSKPRGKAVYAVGVRGGRRAPPTLPITFGDVVSEPLPTEPTEEPKTPAVATPTPAPVAAQVTPATPVAAPTPVRSPAPSSVKPSSWASLLRSTHPGKSAAGTPNSLSVAASSTLPSPSKSIDSLPAESVVSRAGASDGRSTPRSPPAPKPASFNYAAAAAVGAPPTAAEDLARLLTDGLGPRPARAPAPIVPRGLINTGNMCFANTILQVLRYCTPFTELFEELGKRLKADLARRTPLLEAMVIFLREFVPGPSSNGSSNGTSTPKGKAREGNAFIPENVYDAMKENKRFDTMRRGYQEDAEEYLGFFLNTLHEELLDLYSRTAPAKPVSKSAVANGGDSERTIDRPVSPSSGRRNDGDDWLEVGKKQKTHVVRNAETRESSVSRIFGGSLRSVLHTPGSKDSVTLEPYQPLQLDIQAPEVHTLVDALRHLNEPETVPGVWSAARNANVDATKQVYLETLPPVLILHLKRFVYDPQEQNVVKRSKPVAYGTELVIPNEIVSPAKRSPQGIKYRLFGVVYHHGHSATGGHYTVCVARPDGTGWLHFDDEAVQPVPTEDVVVSEAEAESERAGTVGGREKCAYLLFYQRVR